MPGFTIQGQNQTGTTEGSYQLKTVKSYKLKQSVNVLDLPKGAEALSVTTDEDGENAFLHVLTRMTDDSPEDRREFTVAPSGTQGMGLPDEFGVYIGSCSTNESYRFLHVFETTPA